MTTPFADQLYQTATNGAFSPAEAMMWIDEIKNFGRFFVINPNLDFQSKNFFQFFHERTQDVLQVQSPDEFKSYLRAWGKNFFPIAKEIMSSDVSFSSWLYALYERQELIDRGSGMMEHLLQKNPPAHWAQWRQNPPLWEDVRAQCDQLGLRIWPAQHHFQEPLQGHAEELRNVEQALVETGVPFLTLPCNTFESGDLRQAQVFVTQCNKELIALTDWQGGVLGLEGQCALHLGLQRIVHGGACQPLTTDKQVFSIIATDINTPGVVAHEWMHALQNSTENSKRAHKLLLQSASDLLEFDPVCAHPNVEAVWERYTQSLTPQTQKLILSWPRDKNISPSDIALIQNALSQDGKPSWPAHASVVAAQFLVHQTQPQNTWRAFCDFFDQSLMMIDPKDEHEMRGYFSDPKEALSHSIEAVAAHVGMTACSDIKVDLGYRYPLSSVLLEHHKILRKVFERLAPWFEKQKTHKVTQDNCDALSLSKMARNDNKIKPKPAPHRS